jgi:hypothetical protein
MRFFHEKSATSETTCDSCRYRLEEYDMIHMPHPPYSPDLAPSDFYLFPMVKQKLESIQMVENDLFRRLQEILEDIAREELNRVFQT